MKLITAESDNTMAISTKKEIIYKMPEKSNTANHLHCHRLPAGCCGDGLMGQVEDRERGVS